MNKFKAKPCMENRRLMIIKNIYIDIPILTQTTGTIDGHTLVDQPGLQLQNTGIIHDARFG